MKWPFLGQDKGIEDRGLGLEGKLTGTSSFILYNVSDGGADVSQV